MVSLNPMADRFMVQSDLVKTIESMVPVCDKRYHIYNRFRHFWAEIKKLWNYPLALKVNDTRARVQIARTYGHCKTWFGSPNYCQVPETRISG